MSGPNTWTGWRCCATRFSCSITCTVAVYARRLDPAAGRDGGAADRRFIRRSLLLAVFALPTVLTSTWRPGVERAAEERGAPANRLARHLFNLATTAPPGKEVRVTRHRRSAWLANAARRGSAGTRRSLQPLEQRGVARARHGRSSAPHMSAPWFSLSSVLRASAGDVLLVLAAGARLSSYVAATVGEIGFLRGIWLDGSKRLAWLEDYAASLVEHRDAQVPERLQEGIRFEHVSFAYPGTERVVLEDVNLRSRARIGGGDRRRKRRGQDDSGEAPLRFVPADERADPDRRRRSGAHAAGCVAFTARRGRFRTSSDSSFECATAWASAMCRVSTMCQRWSGDRASRRGRRDRTTSTSGLETQLGPTWPGGVEISFGQWQKLALARGFMRDDPLLLVLDEPTAALDAETEHALFERYAAAAREPEGATAASRSSCRTASAPCAWPTSSSCSMGRTWSNREHMKS